MDVDDGVERAVGLGAVEGEEVLSNPLLNILPMMLLLPLLPLPLLLPPPPLLLLLLAPIKSSTSLHHNLACTNCSASLQTSTGKSAE